MLRNILFLLLILLILRMFFPELNETLHHLIAALVNALDTLITGTSHIQ